MDNKIQYYDINKTLSKQRIFNFVLGARGCGKSYAFKQRVIKNFLEKGEQFVYIRRYETEIPASQMRNFFDDVSQNWPDVEFKSHNGLFKINNKIAGWYIPLSKATMLKSIPYPLVTLIGFDEFIIETGFARYLPNEVRSLLECYSTISRDRDVPILFLSNSISRFNPYFVYFDIKMEEGQTTKLTPFISVEYLQLESFSEHMKNTKFGQLVAGTAYGEYAHANKFLLDTDDFIAKLPADATYMCTFIIKDHKIGFYNAVSGNYYMSKKIDPSCKRVFALSVDEHNEATQLALRSNMFVITALQSFSTGTLRFSDLVTKNLVQDVLKKYL